MTVPERMSEEFRRLDDELAGAVGLPSVDAVIRRTGMLNRASTAAAAAVITVGALGGLTAVAQASVGRSTSAAAAVVATGAPSVSPPSSLVEVTTAPPTTTVAPPVVAPVSVAPVVHPTTRPRVYVTYRRRPVPVTPTHVVVAPPPPPPPVVTTTKPPPAGGGGEGDQDPPTSDTPPSSADTTAPKSHPTANDPQSTDPSDNGTGGPTTTSGN